MTAPKKSTSNRRSFLSVVGKLGGLAMLIPFLSRLSEPEVDEFVIIDGWVLRADDLNT